VQALIACLDDRYWHARQIAAETLGKIGDRRAVQPLIRVLEQRSYTGTGGRLSVDWDEFVYSAAIEALANLGDDHALEILTQLSEDPSANVRQGAAQALGKWKHKKAVQEHVSVDVCIKMLGDSNQKVRISAVQTLAKLNDPQAVPALIRGLKDAFLCGEILDYLDKMQFDATSVGLLLSATEEENENGERFILDRLKRIGPAAANRLTEALNAPNHPQRLMAARALAAIKDVRAIEPLLNEVQQRQRGIHWDIILALAEIGLPAIQVLLKQLAPGDNSVSLHARNVLDAMGTASIPVFIRVMEGSQPDAYARYQCAEMITSLCEKNKTALKEKWQSCVCGEHLARFSEIPLPFSVQLGRISEMRSRDYYLRQHPFLNRLANEGWISTGFGAFLSEVFRILSSTSYYACPICSQDRGYYSPVRQIILVLDDRAKNPAPSVKNGTLYYPWSPLMAAFRFHQVEIRTVLYPYSTSIERFVHRMELERRPSKTPTTQPMEKIPCIISDGCNLSAADQNRLQTYFKLN
jgi:HEAT repeat protein